MAQNFDRNKPLRRCVFEIYEHDMRFLDQTIPHGMKSAVFRTMTDQLIALVKEHGPAVLYEITAKNYGYVKIKSNPTGEEE